MYKARLLILLFLYSSVMANEQMATCESRFGRLVENYSWEEVKKPVLIKKLIYEWGKSEKNCNNQTFFYASLASLYINLEDYKKARKILNKALSEAPSDADTRELETTLIDVDINENFTKGVVDNIVWQKIVGKKRDIIAKYPDWYLSYYGMGNLLVRLKMFEEAKPYLLQSIDLKETVHTYYLLAIVYTELKNYVNGIKAMDRAVQMDKTIIQGKEFLYAAVVAHASVGKIDSSKRFLKLLIQFHPEEKENPRFYSSIEFVKKLMEENLH